MPQLSALKTAEPRRRFWAFVALPAIGFAVALVAFGTWSLWTTADKSDLALRDRQVREVELALGATLDELAQSQAGVAIWDPAVAELAKPEPDLDWLDLNVGTWLNYVFNHELDLIVDGDGQPLYAMENGVRARPETFARIEPGVRPLLDAMRGPSRTPANPHERLPDRPLHPDSSVRTSPFALHATDLVVVDGQPAVASVMRMMPDSYAPDANAGSAPLLISIRYLNSGLMRDLQRVRGIVDARVTRLPTERGAGEYSVPLSSSRGERIGYFTWRPEMPGKNILGSVLLEGGIALVALVALLAGLIAGIGRLMAKDARSIAVLVEARRELQAKEAQAQYLANHDPLTGLPNRTSFGGFVENAIAGMGEGRMVGVMMIDLDRFKNVNDTLGHLAGDRLIQSVAARFTSSVADRGFVARLGGDEYAICVPDCSDTAQLAEIAEIILGDLGAQYSVLGSSVRVGGSIGLSVCSTQETDRTELLRRADIAMYQAKEAGGDAYRFFTPEMDECLATRQAIENDLRAALRDGDALFVEYQPKLDAAGGRIIGLEALVRWRHPSRGELAPSVFVPIAEDCGLINPLGEWVLCEACRVARRWPHLNMAVNVSPAQFRMAGIAEKLRTIVCDAGVRPQQIELEITESILIEDDIVVKGALDELRSAGFRIALDDFGTGYSSLSYLKKFYVDSIKIDRSFVTRLGQDPEATAIVQALIALGHAMALSVTAEGVETEEQRCLLRMAGCNELQGFLFSRAVIEGDLDALLDHAQTQLMPEHRARSLSA